MKKQSLFLFLALFIGASLPMMKGYDANACDKKYHKNTLVPKKSMAKEIPVVADEDVYDQYGKWPLPLISL